MKTIYTFVISIAVLGILDFIWLGLISAKTYKQLLSPIGKMGPTGSFEPRLFAMICVYIAIALSFVIFVLPQIKNLGLVDAFIYGAVFGILVYAIYEFTNYSILKDWPKKLVIIDTLWGGVLYGLSSVVVPYILKLLRIW